MKFTITVLLFVLSFSLLAAQEKEREILSNEVQIKVASMAAPADKREGVTVLGYDKEGQLVTLKKGTNDIICLAPEPGGSMIYTYAYFEKLEPFMKRGRELRAEGKNFKEKNEIREAEIKADKLNMPQTPTILYCYWGKRTNLDRETGEIKGALRRYVVYMPYATSEETGLSDRPTDPGMPWLMNAGTYRAHIMINPPNMNHHH